MAAKLLLASASPRRQGILGLLGLPFEIVAPPDEEAPPIEETNMPEALAQRRALAKARAVAQDRGSALVLGADTLVVDGAQVLGKPTSAAEATQMLRRLRGREHRVITGVALVKAASGCEEVAHQTTLVTMRSYSDSEIADYVRSGDPFDKAGAYAIQHPAFHPVAAIEGCYLNVVGLPLCDVVEMLRRRGLALPPPKALPDECAACPLGSALGGIEES